MNKQIQIAGIPINNSSYEEILNEIDEIIKKNKKTYFVTVNPEMVLMASEDRDFFEILKKSEINTSDGIGILWAAYFLSLPKRECKIRRFLQFAWSLFSISFTPNSIRSVISERITGTDLFPKIIDRSQKKEWKIFLLGAEEGIAYKVIDKFSKLYPKAHFAGCFAGSPSVDDEKEIYDIINKAKPDILLVAYGAPKQEFWIHRNLSKLNSVKVAIGVGGTFDFHAGKAKRAPEFLRKIGLEWLWRLLREPKRFNRICNATFRFIRLIYKQKNG